MGRFAETTVYLYSQLIETREPEIFLLNSSTFYAITRNGQIINDNSWKALEMRCVIIASDYYLPNVYVKHVTIDTCLSVVPFKLLLDKFLSMLSPLILLENHNSIK